MRAGFYANITTLIVYMYNSTLLVKTQVFYVEKQMDAVGREDKLCYTYSL